MSEKKPRARLEKVGLAILEDYVLHHPDGTHPTTIAQKTLLEQVQKAQGNPNIKLLTIQNWFRRRRSKAQVTAAQFAGTPPISTSPLSNTPFSEENLRMLHTLVQNTPNPGPDLLDTWGTLFHVSQPVLQYTIACVLPSKFPPIQGQAPAPASNFSNAIDSIICTHSQRLPTPPDSSTPEPGIRNKQSFTTSPEACKDEIPSPVLEHRPLGSGGVRRINEASALPLVNHPSHSQLSPPLTPIVPAAKVNLKTPVTTQTTPTLDAEVAPHMKLTRTICSGVLTACANNATNADKPRPLPRTSAESEARFAPYRESLEKLSRSINFPPESTSSSFR